MGVSLWWLLLLWSTGSSVQAQQLWLTGLVAPRHVGSSRTGARTRVPCIGRWTLNHCTTREAQSSLLSKCSQSTAVRYPGSYPVALTCIASVPNITSWPKMAASFPAIMSTFQTAGQRKQKRRVEVNVLLFKDFLEVADAISTYIQNLVLWPHLIAQKTGNLVFILNGHVNHVGRSRYWGTTSSFSYRRF